MEVLICAILWIGLLAEPEPVESFVRVVHF